MIQVSTFSVIVRTKDRPTLLARCLASIAAQQRLPDTVIIVNDGGKIVENIIAQFPQLTIQSLNNPQSRGRAAAANQGVFAASSDFICFLDDDDVMLPEHLAVLSEALQTTQALVAYTGCRLVKYPQSTDGEMSGQVVGEFNEPFLRDRLHYENYIPFINLAIKRELWFVVGGLDESFDIFEDWDVLYRLSQHSDFVHVNQITTEYSIWGNTQITQSATHEQWKAAYQQFLQKHWLSLGNEQQLTDLVEYWLVSQARRSEVTQLKTQLAEAQQQQHLSAQQQLELVSTIQQLQHKLSELSSYSLLGMDKATLNHLVVPPSVYELGSNTYITTDYLRIIDWAEHRLRSVTDIEQQLNDLIQLMSKSFWWQVRRYVGTLQSLQQQLQPLRLRELNYPIPPVRPLSNVAPTYITYAKAPDNDTEFSKHGYFMETVQTIGKLPVALTANEALVFTVYCTRPNFYRIDLMMATYMRVNLCHWRVIVRDGFSKKILRLQWLRGIEVLDNRYHSVIFEPFEDSQGKTYQIEIDSPNADADNTVAVWCHPLSALPLRREVETHSHYASRIQPLPTNPVANTYILVEVIGSAHALLIELLDDDEDIDLAQYIEAVLEPWKTAFAALRFTVHFKTLKYLQLPDTLPLTLLEEITELPAQVHWLWIAHSGALPAPDFLVNALSIEDLYSVALLIPQEVDFEGNIVASYGVLTREGVIEDNAAGMAADHPAHGYRRTVEATISQCVGCHVGALRKIARASLHYYHSALYQWAELIQTCQKQGYRSVYQSFLRYQVTQSLPLPTLAVSVLHADRVYFYQRWRERLAKWKNSYQGAKQQTQVCGQISALIIEGTLPEFDKDSGSLRLLTLLKLWRNLGYHLTYFPANGDSRPYYRQALESLGIEVYCRPPSAVEIAPERGISTAANPYSLQQLLIERVFKFAWVARVEIAHRLLPILQLYAPEVVTLYDTVDIHYLREMRQAEIENNATLLKTAQQTKRKELSNCLLAHQVITVTEQDAQHLRAELPNVSYAVLPNIHTVEMATAGFSERQGLVFLGNYAHAPNEDAVVFFVEQVLPLVHQQLPDVVFYVLGSNVTARLQALASDKVQIVGWVKEVEPEFLKYRVFVSYLRYGAGMKGKLGQALAAGLPIVTTAIGAEGMSLKAGEQALLAETPADFAAAVCRLYADAGLWERLAAAGRAHVASHWSESVIGEKLRGILDNFNGAVK